MQTRQLGRSDLHLTLVGLGTWAIGGPWDWGWGPQSDADSIATIQRALGEGVNWIDTAPAYGLGHAETIVGRAIRGRRGEVIVATKCGLVWDDRASGRVSARLTAASVRAECEASLRRLGVDTIDLYQVHWPNPDTQIEESWGEIARLIEEGLVRYGGVSNFSPAQVRRAQAIHPVTSHQPPYSLINRSIERELLPFCRAEEIGVVAYSPMQAGLLTGKFDRAAIAALAADDWRRKGSSFREPALSANLALVEGLRPIAARAGCSLAQLAIAWVLRDAQVTSAIVGARRPDQIVQTAAAGDLALDPADLAAIDALLVTPGDKA